MSSDSDPSDPSDRGDVVDQIKRKAEKKKRARRRKNSDEGIWFGLGMYGLVGWAVSVPMLLGLALGIWFDRVTDAAFSWTLTMLVVGVAAGSLNAWYWITHGHRDE